MPNKESNDNVSRVVAEFFKKKPMSGSSSRPHRRAHDAYKQSEQRTQSEALGERKATENESREAPQSSGNRNGYRGKPPRNFKSQATNTEYVSDNHVSDASVSETAEAGTEQYSHRKNRHDRNNGNQKRMRSRDERFAEKSADISDSEPDAQLELNASLPITDYDPEAPTEIVGVSFKQGGKIYFFAPGGLVLSRGDTVIVETSRGLEYGFVQTPNTNVKAREIISTLKTVIRCATDEDTAHYEDNCRRVAEAMKICNERIAFRGLDMKLVDVEYTFDNSKLLFYFTSDARVDFRELVKDLAGIFKTRIELRQIGIREETKLIGGLGICGRPFCCKTFLNDFVQVSIKMAKEQGLSLNSSKISGACGRLMCCLRYEYETYEDELRRTPKCDTPVMTPDGPGVVCETQPLAGLCKVRITKDGETVINVYHRDDLKRRDAGE